MQLQDMSAQNGERQLQIGDLVPESEAAALLRVAVRTLRNWRALRTGPRYRKIGLRLVRYHLADLAAFIAGDERGTNGTTRSS